jgi:Methyltransferase domain
MALLSRGPKVAVEVVRAFAREPRRALQLLQNLPFALRGLRAAEEWHAGRLNGAAQNEPPAGSLRRYFDEHRSGPGIWKWLHYFELYEHHFARFVGREVNVLEIGIYSGGSLGMWREYFGPRCNVYGVDIEPACRAYVGERTQVFIGDQADRDFWRRLRTQAPPFDIVIDDGGHLPEQQIVTLEEVLPHMNPGGVYVCEDLSGEFNAFSAYVQNLSARLNDAERLTRSETGELNLETTAFQAAIHSVHFYPFVSVIELRGGALGHFSAPKHGTSWEPFFD